jgi:hypothetical protein
MIFIIPFLFEVTQMFIEKRKALFMFIAVIIGLVVFWPADEIPQPLEPEASEVAIKTPPELIKPQTAAKPLKLVQPIQTSSPAAISVEQGMQHEMKRVADIYEQRSQYAPYSLYLSAEQTDLIHPNQSHESPRGYDVDGHNISILIKPKNYRFSATEKIEVEVFIQSSAEGLKSITQLTVDLMATNSKALWPLKIVRSHEQQGERRIQAELDLSNELTNFSAGDYSIAVKASFNGESPIIQSAPIKIVSTIARVVGLGQNRIENNDLIIPINIDADISGYYQLSASLFDVKSNSAISFLIAKERLSSGSNTLSVKVQGLVLRDKGFSGPFRLQGITLVKKSERPGMKEEYGIADKSYEVEGINLDDFESIPYEDPMTEQRLEFMRSIGQ